MEIEEPYIEYLRREIVEQYKEHPTGCGGSFGEILCWELHTNQTTFKGLAEKWGLPLSTIGELVKDHCDRLQELPKVNFAHATPNPTHPMEKRPHNLYSKREEKEEVRLASNYSLWKQVKWRVGHNLDLVREGESVIDAIDRLYKEAGGHWWPRESSYEKQEALANDADRAVLNAEDEIRMKAHAPSTTEEDWDIGGDIGIQAALILDTAFPNKYSSSFLETFERKVADMVNPKLKVLLSYYRAKWDYAQYNEGLRVSWGKAWEEATKVERQRILTLIEGELKEAGEGAKMGDYHCIGACEALTSLLAKIKLK